MSAADPAVAPKVPWWERGADRLNSILVKETRQALKSRQFILTFLLLLLAAWAVSVIGTAMNTTNVEYGTAGRDFFIGFYVVLALATIIAVPFNAYRSLLAERDHNTYDLLSITTLSPGKIVRGKLWSAMLQLFIFYSAITPFMAFASLLNGFDAPTAAYVLAASFLASILLCTAALMFATFAKQRIWQGFASLGILGLLGWVFMGAVMIVGESVSRNFLTLDDPDLWLASVCCVISGLSYFALFQQITIAQLTFDSGNRSTGIRLAATGQFTLFWVMVFGLFYWNASRMPWVPDEVPITFAVMSGIHWAVFGLFAVTEPEWLSRRVHRDLPKNRLLRLLLTPFLPGGSRGLLWVLGGLICLWWLVLLFWGFLQNDPTTSFTSSTTSVTPGGAVSSSLPATAFGDRWERGLKTLNSEFGRTFGSFPDGWSNPMQLVTAISLYLFIVLGLASLVGRLLRRVSTDIVPAHIRVLTVIAVTLVAMVPMILRAMRILTDRTYRLIDILNPFDTLFHIGDNRSVSGEPILMILFILGFAVLGMNVPALLEGIREVRADKPNAPV